MFLFAVTVPSLVDGDAHGISSGINQYSKGSQLIKHHLSVVKSMLLLISLPSKILSLEDHY